MKKAKFQKLFIVAVVMLATTLPAHSQMSIGANISEGANYIRVKKNTDEFTKFKIDHVYKIGLFVEYQINDFILSTGSDLLFREVSSITKKPNFIQGPPYSYMNKFAKSYISFPLVFGYKISPKVQINTGIINNLFIKERVIAYQNQLSTNIDSLQNNEYSMALSLEIQFRVTKKINMSISWQPDYLSSYKNKGTPMMPLYIINHSIFLSLSYNFFEFKKNGSQGAISCLPF